MTHNPSRPFRVRNARPLSMQRVLGYHLVPATQDRGRSEVSLTEEEYTSEPVQGLLALGRLSTVEVPDGWAPPQPEQPALLTESPEVPSEAEQADDLPEEPTGEAVDTPPSEAPTETTPETEVVASELPTPPEQGWTRESLEAIEDFGKIKAIAEGLGLKKSGGRSTIINRILGIEEEQP